MSTNKKREGINRFTCDVSLYDTEKPKASVKYHKHPLPIIPFGIVAYGFVGQPFSKQLYVIAWGRGQLRINLTSIFKVFKKLPESRRKTLENFENTSEITLIAREHLRVYHIKGKILYKGQLSRSCRKKVRRLPLFNRLAVARRNPTITVSKTQQVQFTQSNFFTNTTLSNLILLTCFAKLATA